MQSSPWNVIKGWFSQCTQPACHQPFQPTSSLNGYAHGTAFMTFVHAITAVPQLRSSCSLILTDGQTPGSGIKTMRLVSKQLRLVMLDAVQGYTLHLNETGADLNHQVAAFQGTRLSSLRVVVTNKTNDIDLNVQHRLHLRYFLSEMGQAIKGITFLGIDVHDVCSSSAEDMTVLLSEVAPACPSLQRLKLRGNVGRELLAAVGACCRNVWSLEVMEGVSCEALQQLHLVLPRLTHCKVAADCMSGDDIPNAKPCCLALLSCASLTVLDIGLSCLTLPMWKAFPAGLTELRCSFDGDCDVPADIRPLESLEHILCYCNPYGNHVSALNLIAVLRVAPKLKSVMVLGYGPHTEGASLASEIYLQCETSSIPDLVYLHDRVSSGLVVTSTMCRGGGHFPGLNLGLSSYMDSDDEGDEGGEYKDLMQYMSVLPVFPAFQGLVLLCDKPQPDLSLLARKAAALFPNLKALVLDFPVSMTREDLKSLAAFPALQHLSLWEANINLASLAVLCTHMPLLVTLRLEMCRELTAQDAICVQNALHDWGSSITVEVVRAQ